jgi:hypothetical protein
MAVLHLYSNTPTVTTASEGVELAVGTAIANSVKGKIVSLRFYKSSSDQRESTVMRLWNTSGTELGSVTISHAKTASGWQEANLASPVTVAASITSVVSVTLPSPGVLQYTANGLTSKLTNGVLSAPAKGGRYRYKSESTPYPFTTQESNNLFYVDIGFEEEGSAKTVTGSLSVSGTGTVSAGGTRTTATGAAVSGTGAVGMAGVRTRFTGATIIGNGSVAATGVRVRSSGIAIAGTGTIAGSGIRTRLGSLAISGHGTLALVGLRIAPTGLAIVGTGTLTFSSSVGSTKTGSLNISGHGTVGLQGVRVRTSAASVQGTGSLAGSGQRVRAGSIHLTGTGALSGSGIRTAVSAATVTGNGAMFLHGVRVRLGSLSIHGTGNITASGRTGLLGFGTATGTLSITVYEASYGGNIATISHVPSSTVTRTGEHEYLLDVGQAAAMLDVPEVATTLEVTRTVEELPSVFEDRMTCDVTA